MMYHKGMNSTKKELNYSQ